MSDPDLPECHPAPRIACEGCGALTHNLMSRICDGCADDVSEMKHDEALAMLSEPPAMLKIDGFDDCIVGVVSRVGEPDLLCYSSERILTKLKDEQVMSDHDALEFYLEHFLGADMGAGTPCFISPLSDSLNRGG